MRVTRSVQPVMRPKRRSWENLTGIIFTFTSSAWRLVHQI